MEGLRGRERARGRRIPPAGVKAKGLWSARSGLPWAARKERLEVVDGVHEVTLLNGHGEIDRVEVDLAAEAAAEIRTRVDRRMALVATGTTKGQLSLAKFARPLQFLQEGRP